MSTAIASPPVVAVTLSIASPSRSTATTVAPRSASISALARPIPLAAPVTTMTAPEMFAVVIVVPLSVASCNDGRRRPGVALPDRNRLLECGAASAVARYCNSPGFGAALPNRGLGPDLFPGPDEKGPRSSAIRQMGLPTRDLNVVQSAASPASVVAIVCYVLCCLKFRFGHAIQAIQGGQLDVDVLADHVGGDACVAQPQRQRIR